jgi:hypothetical protein
MSYIGEYYDLQYSGFPSVEDQPHITLELSFVFGAFFDIWGIWPLYVPIT